MYASHLVSELITFTSMKLFFTHTCTATFIKHLMWPLNITLHLTGFFIAIERVILNLIEKYKGLAVAKVTPK